MDHVKSSPPLAPLRDVAERLEREGLVCALGGSGLLAALGLADTVRDWDLTTDEPLERVRLALDDLDARHVGPAGLHADDKLMLRGGEIEIIVGFAIRSPAGVARIPTLVSTRWNGVPLGSPEAWAAACWLLGRRERSEIVLAHLAARGAQAAAVARLTEQPLPPELAARLAALPRLTSRST